VSLPTEVLITETISAEDATQLVEDFEMIGLTADLREVSLRRSIDDIAWFVLAALLLQPFLDKLAEDFVADAYERINAFMTVLLHGRRSSTGTRRLLVLQDVLTGVQIVLEPDLPLRVTSNFSVLIFPTSDGGHCTTTYAVVSGAPNLTRQTRPHLNHLLKASHQQCHDRVGPTAAQHLDHISWMPAGVMAHIRQHPPPMALADDAAPFGPTPPMDAIHNRRWADSRPSTLRQKRMFPPTPPDKSPQETKLTSTLLASSARGRSPTHP
jgi:hypothetical protein